MIAKTILQKHVHELSKKLQPFTDVHFKWAYDTIFQKYLFRTKNEATCSECGHRWKTSDTHAFCPVCNSELKLWVKGTRTIREYNYFCVFDICEGFQVIRFVYIYRKCKSKQKRECTVEEVYQHWISPEGKLTIRSIEYNPFHYGYIEGWRIGTDMSIKKNHNRFWTNNAVIYNKSKATKTIKRNGYKGALHHIHPTTLFIDILTDCKAETLYKAKQISLLKHIGGYDEKVIQYWSSIKICIRNKYIVKDAGIWFDYLDLLSELGKDIRNAKYVCPVNLKLEHNILVARKEHEVEQQDRLQYFQAKGKFFNLKFTDKELSIVVLKDIDDFKKEGKLLMHCVYENEYYKKKDSLILSARKGEKRLETIELDIKQMKIIQCRGFDNKSSRYHKPILNLMNSNLNVIQEVINN